MTKLLPLPVLKRFSDHYRKATGLSLAIFDGAGNLLFGEVRELCPSDSGDARRGCDALYRRAVARLAGGGEAIIFRCRHGFMFFAAPLRFAEMGAGSIAVLGGPSLPESIPHGDETTDDGTLGVGEDEALTRRPDSGVPVIAPRRLLEFAKLATLSLQSVVEANGAREDFALRQRRVTTLFEVASDLVRVPSAHELYALALNTLGVLFDVASAAILVRDPGAEVFRVHTAMGSLETTLRSWAVPVENLLSPAGATPVQTVRVDDPHTLIKLGLPEQAERLLGFPLAGAVEGLGILAILNTDLSAEEQRLIRGLSAQLSLAMEGHRLQTALQEKERELQAVQTMTRDFVRCLETGDLFRAILDQARGITGAQKGSLMVPAKGNGELVVRAVDGLNGQIAEKLRIPRGEGVAGRVFESGEPVLVQNVEEDPRFRRKNRPRYSTKSFVSLPLTAEGSTMGVVNLSDKLTGETFSEIDLRSLQSMAAQASIAIGRSAYYEQSRELRKISITDSLTGLLNRRYLQERLAEEVDRSTRHGHSLSLMMVDIDHFKMYNDANGHPAGDKALVLVGRALRASIRAIDVVSRFGGEEFAIILPETRKNEALEIGERVRAEVEGLYFPGEESLPSHRLTVSIGVASFPEDARDLKTLIQRADRALYRAKERGRNAIVPYEDPHDASAGAPPPWTKVL